MESLPFNPDMLTSVGGPAVVALLLMASLKQVLSPPPWAKVVIVFGFAALGTLAGQLLVLKAEPAWTMLAALAVTNGFMAIGMHGAQKSTISPNRERNPVKP